MKILGSTISKQPRAVSNGVRSLGGALLCLLPILIASSTPPTLLEKVQTEGVLHMITLNGPSTYYEGPFGHAGFEYDLAESFANDLGVELAVTDKGNLKAILEEMPTTEEHFAAASISIIDSRKPIIHYSLPYTTTKQQVVYRRDEDKPNSIEDLIGKDIVVISHSSHAATLKRLQAQYPSLTWREEDDIESADLLEQVHSGLADISIVDSTAFITNKAVYPKARAAFVLDEIDEIAWAFPKTSDKSLLNAANAFIKQSIEDGTIEHLRKKYFSQSTVDESNALAFAKRVEERLPQWVPFFKDSAKEFDLDWMFLAAISYQESLWNKDAKSFTGVRGLMMLTTATAKDLGISDRTDPQQSIMGGAKYFTQMRKRIPADITEPDRTWMALAAYNVGLGHLEDARVLTQKQGGNPDLWEDVRERLPLLAKYAYYRNTKHGYARGWEPVNYVKRIRSYHNILVWHFDNKNKNEASDLEETLSTEAIKKVNDSMSRL